MAVTKESNLSASFSISLDKGSTRRVASPWCILAHFFEAVANHEDLLILLPSPAESVLAEYIGPDRAAENRYRKRMNGAAEKKRPEI